MLTHLAEIRLIFGLRVVVDTSSRLIKNGGGKKRNEGKEKATEISGKAVAPGGIETAYGIFEKNMTAPSKQPLRVLRRLALWSGSSVNGGSCPGALEAGRKLGRGDLRVRKAFVRDFSFTRWTPGN